MRRNRNNLDRTGQLAKEDGEGKTFQDKPAQCRRTRDGEAVRCLADVFDGGGYFREIASTKTGLP